MGNDSIMGGIMKLEFVFFFSGLFSLLMLPSESMAQSSHSQTYASGRLNQSQMKECEKALDRFFYNNYTRSSKVLAKLKAYKIEESGGFWGRIAGSESKEDGMHEVINAIEKLNTLGIGVQPVSIFNKSNEADFYGKFPTIHMKDLALKKNFKIGGQERSAVNIVCSGQTVSPKRGDGNTMSYSASKTLEFLKKEYKSLIFPAYNSESNNYLASDLRFPKGMPPDLKNEYLDEIKKIISEIESLQKLSFAK